MQIAVFAEPEPVFQPRTTADARVVPDPWSASALPPFVRARRFLEHAGTLSTRAWADVLHGAAHVDAAARRGAMQHMGELLETHTRRRSCDALLRVAQDTVDAAREHSRLGVDVAARAATLASGAAFALVLRDWLPAPDFDTLFAPFGAVLRSDTRAWEER